MDTLLTPYYEEAGITIYHGDCRDVLPHLPKVDLVLTDPPYGMNWDTDSTRFSGGYNPAHRGAGKCRERVYGDAEPFDPSPFLNYQNAIIWGANHFGARLPVGTTLVWIKRYDEAFGSFLSDAELAWMKGGYGVYCYRDLSMNAEALTRSHPCQKPISLMKWCIDRSGTAGTILDPFMGSGTTLRAAKDLGRRCIGIEIEEKYVKIAIERLRQSTLKFEESRAIENERVQSSLLEAMGREE